MGRASRRKRERAPLLREPGLCACYAGYACNPGCTCSGHPCKTARGPIVPRRRLRRGDVVVSCDQCQFRLMYDGEYDQDLLDGARVIRYHRATAHQRPAVNRLAA